MLAGFKLDPKRKSKWDLSTQIVFRMIKLLSHWQMHVQGTASNIHALQYCAHGVRTIPTNHSLLVLFLQPYLVCTDMESDLG